MVLKNLISERVSHIEEGSISKLLKIAVERKDIISLGPGEPDFLPPKHILTAAKKAIDQGYTHYSPTGGRKELKEEIVKKLKKENKINLNPENVVITTGSTEAILLSLMCVTDPGEHILVPDPGFLDFQPAVEILSGHPTPIPLYFENNFQYDCSEMKKIIDPKRTRAMIINTPSNPVGSILKKKTLEEIASFAIDNDILIISDEAYEKFVYKGKHISIGSLNGMKEYVLTLHTFSKIYGMAGFRVGYAAGPEKIIERMAKLHLTTTLASPTVSQIAALAALKGSNVFMKKIIKEYNKRRIFLVKKLKEMEFEPFDPEGAFYVFSKYPSKMNSTKFSNWLIKNAKVAAVPGIDFGKMGENYIRFSFATPFNLIKKAMINIEKSMKKLKK